MRIRIVFASSTLAAMSCTYMAGAQQSTESYEYDAPGWLVKVVTSGGSNDNEAHSI